MINEGAMMLKIFIFAIFIASACKGEDCVWNKDTDYPSNPALLIDLETWVSLKAVDEGGQRIVRVAENRTIVVACSGTTITTLGLEVTEGVCAGGKFLNVNETLYTISDLACTSTIKDTVLEHQGTCGDGGIGDLCYLGFNVTNYQFYPVIRNCFDHATQRALYSEDIIYGKSVSASDGNPNKPSFAGGDHFYPDIDPNECYLTANQDAYFTSFTGNPNFIDLENDTYFSRGHLAPNGDFFTDMEGDASYYYPNAVPQWQIYNAANWAFMEFDSRQLAEAHLSDLHVYTGPYGTLVLTDINNNPTDMFICNDQNLQIIPIPSLIWKVIYEPTTDRGVAILGSNNPYDTTPPVPICPDIGCSQLTWLTIDPSSLEKGFTYCCTVQDLHAVYPHAPDLPTATLLTD